jgi:hypothetical protein
MTANAHQIGKLQDSAKRLASALRDAYPLRDSDLVRDIHVPDLTIGDLRRFWFAVHSLIDRLECEDREEMPRLTIISDSLRPRGKASSA